MVPKISCELKERLAKAGFTNIIEVQKIIPLNHSGKVGQLIWYCIAFILIFISFTHNYCFYFICQG
jgi:hypothetical protein